MSGPDAPADAAEPRRRAKAPRPSPQHRPPSEGDPQRLLHELVVHQIDLEMQNEMLRRTRAELEAALEQYTALYDFAPAGYFTLASDSTIRRANLAGARLLGMERSLLVNRRFGQFVAERDRRAFSDFLETVFANQAPGRCDVTLAQGSSPPLAVAIAGARSADGRECRAVVVDITERKEAEAAWRECVAATRARADELAAQLAATPALTFMAHDPGCRRMTSSAAALRLVKGAAADQAGLPHEGLSEREFQVLRWIAAGKTGKVIAGELGLSPKTVSTYRARVFKKLRFGSTAELVRYAVRYGLV